MLTPKLQSFVAAFTGIAGVFFIVVGARMWMRTSGLQSRAVVTTAAVTSVRERGDSDTGIVATYEFEVGGTRFHHVGLFAEVPAHITLEEANDPSRTIRVRYLPEDPSVNEPVSGATPSAPRQLIAIGIGIVLVLAGLVRWVRARRPPRSDRGRGTTPDSR